MCRKCLSIFSNSEFKFSILGILKFTLKHIFPQALARFLNHQLWGFLLVLTEMMFRPTFNYTTELPVKNAKIRKNHKI